MVTTAPGTQATPSRIAREWFAHTREFGSSAGAISCVHSPWSESPVSSCRLRLHVPNLPPSPCSIGRLGTGHRGVNWANARRKEEWGSKSSGGCAG